MGLANTQTEVIIACPAVSNTKAGNLTINVPWPNPIAHSAIRLGRSHKDLTLQERAIFITQKPDPITFKHSYGRSSFISYLAGNGNFLAKSGSYLSFAIQKLCSSIAITEIRFNRTALGFPNRVNLSSRLCVQPQHSPNLLVQPNPLLSDHHHGRRQGDIDQNNHRRRIRRVNTLDRPRRLYRF